MILPRLRADLDISPSPDPQNPGIHVRDRMRYSDSWLIIPSLLVQGLHLFDEAHTELDLQAELSRLSGQPDMCASAKQLIEALDGSGFLENARFEELRDGCRRAFADSPVRRAIHAGSAYPQQADALRAMLQTYLDNASAVAKSGLSAIAAPHVSPGGGAEAYGAAYRTLTPDLADRTFVILGTSHYGPINRFGLTRKPFETPLGVTRTDESLLDLFAAHPAVTMEDYCEVIEHSIEFQVLFLQHLYGSDVRILPMLCGHFGPSIWQNGMPEDDEVVENFLTLLRELDAREAGRLFWVLGVDMAHIGQRYGDSFAAHAGRDHMLTIEARDRDRMASLLAGDAQTFWNNVKHNQDDLRWCGSSPFYTFMRAMPDARGTLEHYQQWDIDAESVVSFAGISFKNN